jgi:predicted DNA binding CopG/RHH family protein
MKKVRVDVDPIVRTTVRLPLSLLNAAKHRGIDDGQPLQEVIIRALEQYLRKQKGGRQ